MQARDNLGVLAARAAALGVMATELPLERCGLTPKVARLLHGGLAK